MSWIVSILGAALAATVAVSPVDTGHHTTAADLLHVPTVADPARGLDLWRGTTIGMNPDQVRAIFPRATPPASPTTLTGGETDRLVLDGVDLAGNPAVAHFFFKQYELISVELTLIDLKAGTSARNLHIAQTLSSDFTQLYGQGYDCGERSLGDINAYECNWLKSRLSIRLWYMDTDGQAPLFYLAFRQVDDPGYNL